VLGTEVGGFFFLFLFSKVLAQLQLNLKSRLAVFSIVELF